MTLTIPMLSEELTRPPRSLFDILLFPLVRFTLCYARGANLVASVRIQDLVT